MNFRSKNLDQRSTVAAVVGNWRRDVSGDGGWIVESKLEVWSMSFG